MTDQELRIKCLEISKEDHGRYPGIVFAMKLYDFIAGNDDEELRQAITLIGNEYKEVHALSKEVNKIDD